MTLLIWLNQESRNFIRYLQLPSACMSLIIEHLEHIRGEHPNATAESRPDGTTLITIPKIPLPKGGWNRDHTTVQFLTPVGYPMAKPDCFWTDCDLRLSNGALPKNSQVQVPSFGGQDKLWFSWHASQWNPSRDTLKSYLHIITDRLGRPE